MISSGMRVCTRSQLGKASALPTAPVEVVHTRPREAQIYLTLALGITIYRLEFRTVRKSLGPWGPRARPEPFARPASLSTGRGGKRKCGGIGPPVGGDGTPVGGYRRRGVEAGVELNTRGRYAVTAMADLARYGGGGALALSAISERQQISLSYLEQLFLKLRRAGLVESARGRSGVYRLGRAADPLTVAGAVTGVAREMRKSGMN